MTATWCCLSCLCTNRWQCHCYKPDKVLRYDDALGDAQVAVSTLPLRKLPTLSAGALS